MGEHNLGVLRLAFLIGSFPDSSRNMDNLLNTLEKSL